MKTAGRCAARWSKCGRPMPQDAIGTKWMATTRRSIQTSPAPGALLTDDNGHYSFKTIKPGPYPWGNHHNAWRPAHIHFSLFGAGILSRLVTQMYFPGDPLQPLDPIFNSIPDEAARQRLVSSSIWIVAEPHYALAYVFDIVLRGRNDTPFEEAADERRRSLIPSQLANGRTVLPHRP